MRTSFSVNDMTIHRIVEQEYGFTPMFDFLPTLTKETSRRTSPGWRPAAMTRDRQCRAVLSVVCRQDAAP